MTREDWHSLEIEKLIKLLSCDGEQGLNEREGKERLKKYGPNKLREQEKLQPYQIFINQFKDFMVLVLLVAACLSGMLGEMGDTIAIVAIVILNAILGFIQEFRAEKSLESLKQLTAPQARVLRGNREVRLSAEQLVPGDILLLEAGDIVAADARLLEVINLEVDESMLTGESLPVRKLNKVLFQQETPLGDRRNMIFSGTTVTSGRGKALVVATGMETEIGKIADMIQNVEEEATPLQKRLEQLGKSLVVICLLVCSLVVATGVMRGEELGTMFLTGVSLAVAAIPEGLPAIVTIVLAIGVQRMVKRNAVVRRLPSVETLGCANVICSDKTGTLTQNIMTVQRIYMDDQIIQVTGKGYHPQGDFLLEEQKVETDSGTMMLLLKTAALCNNASLKKAGFSLSSLWRKKKEILKGKRNAAEWEITGDPTEGALLVAAAKANYWRDILEGDQPRITEIPFDSDRKRMSVVCQGKDRQNYVYVKGAPDIIINYCEKILLNNQELELTAKIKERIKDANEGMASQALRVLALAYRRIPFHLTDWAPERLEQDLVFLGLMGMMDPPREEVKEAIRLCRKAGIKTVMVTGDHALTAMSVAKDIGMLTERQEVLTGLELDSLGEGELEKRVENIGVYARVSPKHKLQIVKAWRKKGYIAGMTGDGVNDAPAVKEADIGISMGKTGTDVTKEASSLILMDDNFATIVAAIEEGRAIYDNIRKFITYLLSCNIGEILTMFLATLAGLPLPLIPIQILWVNLVTDGLPAMALGVDSSDRDIMLRPPRKAQENIFSGGLGWKIIKRGIQIGLSTVFVFTVGLYLENGNIDLARTMTFATLVLSQLCFVFTCRSERYSIYELGFFSNLYLVGAVLISLCLLLTAIYIPALQVIFQTIPLGLENWVIIILVSSLPLIISGLGYLWKCLRGTNLTLARAEK